MKDYRIPIIVAVSGHRDIPAESVPTVRATLEEYFNKLRRTYPHSPLQLLSGLAEGADRIAADAAVDQGFELVAVLPFEQSEYEHDFTSQESLSDFRRLISKSTMTVMVAGPESVIDKDEAYLRLGHFLVEYAQVVVAIWNGVSEQVRPDGSIGILTGGTADVVRLCHDGVANAAASMAELPEQRYLRHLYVRRTKHQHEPDFVQGLNPGTWISPEQNTPDAWMKIQSDAILESVDRFNHYCIFNLSRQAIEQSRSWLVGPNPPQAVTGSLAVLVNLFAAADAASTARSTQRFRAITFISVLAMISVIMQQVYSGPDMRWGWLAGHIGIAFCAFLAFRWFFRGYHPREAEYMDWRALAEGLRIQLFWAAASVNASVATHFLSSDTTELDWIRHAIRNLNLQTAKMKNSPCLEWVKQAWIEDQGKWFSQKWPLQKKLARRLTLSANLTFFSAMASTLTTLASHLAGATDPLLNGLVLFSGVTFLLSAVLKAYASQMAYEEQYQRYRDMATIFSKAGVQLNELLMRSDDVGAKKLIHDLGREALTENANWLKLHRQRQFEVDFG